MIKKSLIKHKSKFKLLLLLVLSIVIISFIYIAFKPAGINPKESIKLFNSTEEVEDIIITSNLSNFLLKESELNVGWKWSNNFTVEQVVFTGFQESLLTSYSQEGGLYPKEISDFLFKWSSVSLGAYRFNSSKNARDFFDYLKNKHIFNYSFEREINFTNISSCWGYYDYGIGAGYAKAFCLKNNIVIGEIVKTTEVLINENKSRDMALEFIIRSYNKIN